MTLPPERNSQELGYDVEKAGRNMFIPKVKDVI